MVIDLAGRGQIIGETNLDVIHRAISQSKLIAFRYAHGCSARFEIVAPRALNANEQGEWELIAEPHRQCRPPENLGSVRFSVMQISDVMVLPNRSDDGVDQFASAGSSGSRV